MQYSCEIHNFASQRQEMNIENNVFEESQLVQAWYLTNKRELPWRDTTDPYRIWISEIILQQTRVAQGLDYYLRFIERFPDIRSLANAPLEDVLKLWQGLGYYSRARNLHETAQDLLKRFNGVFPSAYEDIRSLKGVGEYTAAAIASFAWNKPFAVVDGNVLRVLGRLFAIETSVDSAKGKHEYRYLATRLMPPEQAGVHNQALMEFGALQCTPRNPCCQTCPLVNRCVGYASGNPLRFPVKQHKTKITNRYFNYFFVVCGTDTYLHQRNDNDIWKGLFEFPLIETDKPYDLARLKQTAAFKKLFQGTGQSVFSIIEKVYRHVLSHQIVHAKCYMVDIQKENAGLKHFVRIPRKAIDIYPVSKLIMNIISKIEEG